MRIPTRVQTPAMPPNSSALKWYSPSLTPDRLGPRLGDDQAADVPDAAPAGCRSGTAATRSAAAATRRAATSAWSSRTCRSGTARPSRRPGGRGRRRGGRPTGGRPSPLSHRLQREQARVVGVQPDRLDRWAAGVDHRLDGGAVAGDSPGSVAHTATSALGIRALLLVQRDAQQLQARPVLPAAAPGRRRGRRGPRTRAPSAGSRAARRAVSTRKPLARYALLNRPSTSPRRRVSPSVQ